VWSRAPLDKIRNWRREKGVRLLGYHSCLALSSHQSVLHFLLCSVSNMSDTSTETILEAGSVHVTSEITCVKAKAVTVKAVAVGAVTQSEPAVTLAFTLANGPASATTTIPSKHQKNTKAEYT